MHNEQWLRQKYHEISLTERTEYAFISMKIKHFRKLNRLYGRAYCDEAIRQVYDKAKEWINDSGYIAHIYNNAFQILIKMPEGEKDDYTLFLWITDLATTLHRMPDERYFEMLEIGFGVYRLEEQVVDFEIAQYNADTARVMSKEKDFIISHVDFYGTSIRDDSLSVLNYQKKFKHALESGHIHVYLQPKVNLKTGKVTHAEALMRWIDPEHGLLPIHEYIPLLDQCGYMNLVDCYVFKVACKQILDWKQHYGIDIHISVNLSANTFVYPFFLKEFNKIHEEYPCDKACIEIELLESIILNQLERVKVVAKEIKDDGYGTSLDDFGSGYSSYSVLSEAKFDVMKIDRSMFLNDDNQLEQIVNRHVIEMAHELGMRVVAEGIETRKYVDNLIAMDCDYIQGFVFYRPMEIVEFENRFLKQQETVKL